MARNGKRCCLETGARTASWLYVENIHVYVLPIGMIVFIFPIPFINLGVGMQKPD